MNNYYGYQQPFGYQNYNPNYYQQQYQQTYQQPVQQPVQQLQQEEQYLQYVDGIDVVKSTNVLLNGKAMYFPKTDGTEIYCKKLNPQTGVGMITTYRIVQEEQNQNESNDSNIYLMIEDLKNNIEEIKNIVLESATAPSPSKEVRK